eukprot:XP_011666585.1 PREDICTED: uncharacterized protein LOC763226 [Strongylocentrotus purpuratus]
MPRTTFDRSNVQGGKQWGQAKQKQVEEIDDEIETIITQNVYPEVEELEEKLAAYKDQFITYDLDGSGDLGKSIFLLCPPYDPIFSKVLILGICHAWILMFEEKMKAKEIPTGLPPKKSFSDLP